MWPMRGWRSLMIGLTSTRSWLSVFRVWFSQSLREAPTASISSMNTMQGAFFLAAAKSARTRRDPTPTNISSNSLPALRSNMKL